MTSTSDPPGGSPLIPFAYSAILTVALLVLGGTVSATRYADMLEVETLATRLTRLEGVILRLQEILTMSARMAAATGDLQWEQRYRQYDQQLDRAITEAVAIAPGAARSAARAAQAADHQLDARENRVFELTRQGKRAGAAAQFDAGYDRLQETYVRSIGELMTGVGHVVVRRIEDHRRSLIAAVSGSAAMLAYLVVLWVRMLRRIRRYIRDRAAAEDQLRAAQAGLEARVEDRTREVAASLTQQKQLESELQQAQKLESIGRLAAGVAHEINTPVQFVTDSVQFVHDSMADLMTVIDKHRRSTERAAAGQPAPELARDAQAAEIAADLPYLSEQLPRALDRALDGLSRVAAIIHSMKVFAHPRKERCSIDLNEAISSTLTIARGEYKYVADLETELAELPPVSCFAGELNQVILNLVTNAAHAIGEAVAGTDRHGRITVTTRRDGDHAVIAIADTGTGIPPAVRGRIFEPFFTTKDVGKGTGQGLAHARSVIVDKHHGSLTFDTEVGAGTTFTIRIPIAGHEPVAEAPAAA